MSYSITLTASSVEENMKNSHSTKRLLCDSWQWNTTSLRSPSHGQTIDIVFFSEDKLFSFIRRLLNGQPLVQQGLSLENHIMMRPGEVWRRWCFLKIDISYSTELMTAIWTLVQRISAGTTHIVSSFTKSYVRHHSVFTQGHCSCSISFAMLEASIRISTFSVVPAGPVTDMNYNNFGNILICRTQV